MLTHAAIDTQKKAVVFGLDDVLFPERDYVLQVYYLFANFLEYTEATPPANDLIQFLKTAHEQHGEAAIFERSAAAFGIDAKYRAHFDRLHVTARLPLKLLLFPAMQQLMEGLRRSGRQLLVFTDGNPAMQLNKLKHIEWNGLEQAMKVYFAEELRQRNEEPVDFLLRDNGLDATEVLYIHAKTAAGLPGIDGVEVERFLPPAVG